GGCRCSVHTADTAVAHGLSAAERLPRAKCPADSEVGARPEVSAARFPALARLHRNICLYEGVYSLRQAGRIPPWQSAKDRENEAGSLATLTTGRYNQTRNSCPLELKELRQPLASTVLRTLDCSLGARFGACRSRAMIVFPPVSRS